LKRQEYLRSSLTKGERATKEELNDWAEDIASVSGKYSRGSRNLARVMGLADEEYIRDYILTCESDDTETSNNSFNTTSTDGGIDAMANGKKGADLLDAPPLSPTGMIRRLSRYMSKKRMVPAAA